MGKNLLCCNLASYGNYRAAACAHLPMIGIRHIEFPCPPLAEVEKVRNEVSAAGLQLSSLLSRGVDISKDDYLVHAANNAKAARELGVKILFWSVKAGDVPLPAAYDRIRRVGDVGAAHGCVWSMETHPDLCENGDKVLATMEAVNHPAVRHNFDTGNVYYYNEGADAVAEFRKVLPHVASVHLKDTNGGFKAWHFPALGEGIVNFREIFRLANESGFFGPFTMELEGIQGESLTEESQKERVARSVRHLRALGLDL
jgi:sugar phosphate isomerase/epimerase